MLAGISAEYYLRLEQGRDRNPSAQVLESIARVLQLDDDSVAYLLGLAADKPRRARRRPRREAVPPSTAQLVAALPFPAFVEGRYLDVLAANPLAAAVSPRLVTGGNRLRDVFLDPAERALFPDWERAAAGLVAGFRQSVGTDTDDPRCHRAGRRALAGQSRASPAVGPARRRRAPGSAHALRPPAVGELVLNREKLLVGEAQNLTVAIYHADPGTENADKLALLGSAALPPVSARVRLRRHSGSAASRCRLWPRISVSWPGVAAHVIEFEQVVRRSRSRRRSRRSGLPVARGGPRPGSPGLARSCGPSGTRAAGRPP